jgi:uncharacterized protein YecT (DUF1311 family)
MTSKADLEYKKSDNELNRVYKQILSEYKPDSLFIENLKKSQRIWIDFRDAELEMKFPKNDNSVSAKPMCKTLYLAELTNQRIETLKKWLISETEGDVCNGSIRAWEIDTSEYTTKAYIDKNGEVSIFAKMELDHRIFGYEKPDKSSKKLIFFSIFTNDVENNPFNCKYGSYYDTSGLKDMKLIYKSTIDNFIEIEILKNGESIDKVYMDKKWFEFD